MENKFKKAMNILSVHDAGLNLNDRIGAVNKRTRNQ